MDSRVSSLGSGKFMGQFGGPSKDYGRLARDVVKATFMILISASFLSLITLHVFIWLMCWDTNINSQTYRKYNRKSIMVSSFMKRRNVKLYFDLTKRCSAILLSNEIEFLTTILWSIIWHSYEQAQYHLDVFKTRVNRFLARHAPSSTASSLNIRWDCGQIPVY